MNFLIADSHCDTLQKICDSKNTLFSNDFHVSLERMRKNQHIQVFAAFVDRENDKKNPFKRADELLDYYFLEIEKNPDLISHCESLEDIKSAIHEKKTASILSIEGGEALMGDERNLDYFYKKGVRIITLSWNYDNEICGSIGSDKNEGLSDFGKKVVSKMNDLGMIVDTSHISERAFWDVLEATKKPVMASHSNTFSLHDHKRNLKDEQIKAIIKNGGFIGINFYSEFLSKGRCHISDVLRHIEYILSLDGENSIGFGSDFDGMDALPEEIKGICDIEKILEELLKSGYKDTLVKKIASGNFLRVLGENFK